MSAHTSPVIEEIVQVKKWRLKWGCIPVREVHSHCFHVLDFCTRVQDGQYGRCCCYCGEWQVCKRASSKHGTNISAKIRPEDLDTFTPWKFVDNKYFSRPW